MDSVAPGARADRQIDTFIDRRAPKDEDRPGRHYANNLEESWKQGEAERRAEEERIRRMRLLFSYRRRQELHQKLSDEYRAKAERLIADDDGPEAA